MRLQDGLLIAIVFSHQRASLSRVEQFSMELLLFLQLLTAGVSNLRPAGRMWPSQPFHAAFHKIWQLANLRKAKIFCC
jgi:hypothetical protein